MAELNINKENSIISTNLRDNYNVKEKVNKDSNNVSAKPDLFRTTIVKKKVENYSLDDLGKIEYAKKHRSANRPLHKLKDFTDYVNFCYCCSLPCEQEGIIERFHFCDNINNFSECGLGITLFFYFFQFMALIVFMGIFVISISMIIFNNKFTNEIIDKCSEQYNSTENKPLYDCEGFINNAVNETNYYKRFNRWITRLSSDNIKIYRKLPKLLKNREEKKLNKVVVNNSILNFYYLITCFIINILFIIFIKAQEQKARILNFSIRDYTVLITDSKQILIDYNKSQKKDNLDSLQKSQIRIEKEQQFKAFVNDYIKGKKYLYDLEIHNINMCYDLNNYIKLRDEYEEVKKKIFQVENNPYNIKLNNEYHFYEQNRLYYKFHLLDFGICWRYCCCCLYNFDYPLRVLQEQKLSLEDKLNKEQEKVTQDESENIFTGYMLISFNTIKDKERFLAEYPHNFFGMIFYFLKNIKYYVFCCCVNKEENIRFKKVKGIDAYDAPEPEDIIWENFNYTTRGRGIRTIFVFLISILIIIISLGCVFGLTFIQDYLNQHDKTIETIDIFYKYLTSFSITAVISVINFIFQFILEKLTHLEKQISKSNQTLSLSIKITIFTFLNSAIVPLLSKHLLLFYKYKDDEIDIKKERNTLLIYDMLVYFIYNAIITPLFWSFNIPYLFRKIQQCFIEKNPEKNLYINQRDLNKLYEYPDMNLAYKYSYIAKTTAMCLFYMPIFPLGFVFAFIGFIFGYFLEKFNFTHLYKRPEMLDEIITKIYANYFIIILFIGGIGDYIFLYDVYNNNKWSLVNIIIFGILIIIPYTKFINCNFVGIEKSEYLNCPLSKVYLTFYNDYQRQNPLTKKMGLLNYISELKKNDYLSDKAYKIAKEKIEQLNLMEIYYGISRGNIPLAHQSIIANFNNNSVLSTSNLVKPILGGGFLASAIIPKIRDDTQIRNKKKQLLETHIINIFGNEVDDRGVEGDHGIIESFNQLNELNENEKNEQLFDAYNNPLGINMGLGPLPLTVSIYKSQGKDENKNTAKNEFNNNGK